MNDDSPEAHATLVAAHHARLRALLDGDLDALRRLVDESLVFISAAGVAMTWSDVVAGFQAGALKFERMDSSDIATRLYGDIGILIYKANNKGLDDGVAVESVTLSTSVYTKRDGGWKLISQQHSRIE